MCTMVKIKNKNNKMIAWRSWPSPPHLETSLTKASKKGPCGPRQAPSAGGRTDGASLQQSQQRLSLTFLMEEDEEEKRKNKTTNAKGISVGWSSSTT